MAIFSVFMGEYSSDYIYSPFVARVNELFDGCHTRYEELSAAIK